MIDFRQFRALESVALEGSISRAATRLGWSAPTVDYHLEALERAVGAPLLIRGSRGSTLTSVGEFLSDRAHEILALSERALVDARELSELQHTKLRFGTFPTAAAMLLPTVAHEMDRVGIELEATLDEALNLGALLRSRAIDAALTYTVPGVPFELGRDLAAHHVFTDPLMLAVPSDHRLAQSRVVTDQELATTADEKWIMGASADALDERVIEVFTKHGDAPAASIRTDDFSVAAGMVAAGLANAVIPKLALPSPPKGMVLKPFANQRLTREISLLAPKNPGEIQRNAMLHLSNALQRAIRQLNTKPAQQ